MSNKNNAEISIAEKEEMLEMVLLLKNLSKTEKERVRYTLQGIKMADEVATAKAIGA